MNRIYSVERFARRQYLRFLIAPRKNTCLDIAAVSSFKLSSPLKRQNPLQRRPSPHISNLMYTWSRDTNHFSACCKTNNFPSFELINLRFFLVSEFESPRLSIKYSRCWCNLPSPKCAGHIKRLWKTLKVSSPLKELLKALRF